MEVVTLISEFLKNHADTLSILIAVGSIAWSSYQYVSVRRQQNEVEQFRTFHDLIRDLVQPPDNGSMYVDRQIAIVYELRHFPRYFPVSCRILEEFLQKCQQVQESEPKNAKSLTNAERLKREIELAVSFIGKKGAE